ncbi:MAG: magnesium transporter CorA family protein [Deltaproteobacteria bacterium]|nr:magnesium transporter CorA family protein [Deltaproteobacteria bacterium]
MLEIVDEISEGRPWVVAVAPTEEESARLGSEHGVPSVLLAHALDPNERPHVTEKEGALLVVLRAPRRMPAGADVPWSSSPVSLVLGPRAVVTIARDTSGAEVIERARRSDDLIPCAPHRIVIAHVRATADAFLDAIAEIEKTIDAAEVRLAHALGNREVLELVRLMKSLVQFSSALRSLDHVVDRLTKFGGLEVPDEDRCALEDARIELRQALETCDLERETLGATMDAFASVISNNLNDVMKLLASVTVVLTPPIAVAGYWGMNVPVPWAREPWAFLALIALSLVLSFLCALELRRRRWL